MIFHLDRSTKFAFSSATEIRNFFSGLTDEFHPRLINKFYNSTKLPTEEFPNFFPTLTVWFSDFFFSNGKWRFSLWIFPYDLAIKTSEYFFMRLIDKFNDFSSWMVEEFHNFYDNRLAKFSNFFIRRLTNRKTNNWKYSQ